MNVPPPSRINIARCIVCDKKRQYGKKIPFFRFPYEIQRCKSWVQAIGMRELLFMPVEKLRELFVCAEHFEPEFITPKGNHLHQAAVPSITPYPKISNETMSDFPKNRNMTDIGVSQINSEPVINYDRPLMESLETLIHNERHVVQRPAGMNTIAVPLMTYSSSLEKGTVFAAPDPVSTYELPFVPFIEATSHNEDKPFKRYGNVKAMTYSEQTNASYALAVNTEPSEEEDIKTSEPFTKKTLVGTVKPIIKPAQQGLFKSERNRNYNVSIGLNTLITGHSRKTKMFNQKPHETAFNSRSFAIDPRYKNIKQYTNTKLAMNSIKNNVSLTPSTRTPAQVTSGVAPIANMSVKGANVTVTNVKTIKTSTGPIFLDVALLPTTTSAEQTQEATAEPIDTKVYKRSTATGAGGPLVPDPGLTNSIDLMFVPYSQHVMTVAPESTSAHTAEGTLEYGLPLMNCIGTVFQGNIQTTIKTEESGDDQPVIDVPLMKCFKTLEFTDLP